jgi:hypothetical protein
MVPATGNHFDILVDIVRDANGKPQYCELRNIPKPLHPGDTVSYRSTEGKVSITFQPDSSGLFPPPHISLYVDPQGNDLMTVPGGAVLSVQNRGDYFGQCSIIDILTNKPMVEWKEKNPGSASAKDSDEYEKNGGNHVVR